MRRGIGRELLQRGASGVSLLADARNLHGRRAAHPRGCRFRRSRRGAATEEQPTPRGAASVEAARRRVLVDSIDSGSGVRVRAIQTGSLVGNKTFQRATGFSGLLRPREDYGFPVYAYLLEHPAGAIMIDAGLGRYPPFGPLRRMFPLPRFEEGDDIGTQMRRRGLDPADVRRVVLTHLHPDHVGGVGAFAGAEILVHRRELEFATSARGRPVYWPSRWPSFEPVPFDLDPEPYGPFPQSKALTADGDVRLVPIPGHAMGQVGVVVETEPARLFFTADHTMNQAWFIEDESAGRIGMVSRAASKSLGVETSRRIHDFVSSAPTVLVPSHDHEAPGRIARMEPIAF